MDSETPNYHAEFWRSPHHAVLGVLTIGLGFLSAQILPLIVGLGFRNRKRWVKPAGTVLAVVSMINIPIGTALGIYTLKFFRSDGGIKLYGGKVSSINDLQLDKSIERATPLMKWADRLK